MNCGFNPQPKTFPTVVCYEAVLSAILATAWILEFLFMFSSLASRHLILLTGNLLSEPEM